MTKKKNVSILNAKFMTLPKMINVIFSIFSVYICPKNLRSSIKQYFLTTKEKNFESDFFVGSRATNESES